MAQLRRELTCDVQEVGRSTREMANSAREMANPLYFVRRFPWASAIVAAGVGYLLVPKKRQVIKPDPEMLADLIRKQQVNIGTSKATAEKQGMMKSLAVMGLTWAMKAGLQYIGQQVTSAAMAKQHAESTPPSPSPLEEPWNPTR